MGSNYDLLGSIEQGIWKLCEVLAVKKVPKDAIFSFKISKNSPRLSKYSDANIVMIAEETQTFLEHWFEEGYVSVEVSIML